MTRAIDPEVHKKVNGVEEKIRKDVIKSVEKDIKNKKNDIAN